MSPTKANTTTELMLLLTLATFWGASYTFIRVGVATIPPITLIAARTLIAGGILFAIVRWRGITLPRDPAMWCRFLIQACLNSVIPFTLIAWAERTVDAGLATILNSTTPIFTFLLAATLFRNELVTARKLFGIAMGLTGICFIIGFNALNGFGQQLPAQLAVVAASICYAGAALFGRNFKGLDPMMPAVSSLLCGAVVLIPVSLVVDQPWTLTPSMPSIAALLALAILSTAIAFSIYFRLLQTLGSIGTTAQAYLRVPIGVAIGAVFLAEPLTPTAGIGLVCVIVGVMAMTIAPRKRAVSG
ncbi:DMT family transporter [Rhizobium mayense]|uniref:EamA family transporter n=1 Tax=Rhizobium mayense TaxID=1312184 RepID=A0ABT7JRE8_9HYPH|nr:EamA family transporter [Rhizobium mayense]MDL2397748.1 EamA family transporter [Rhizobium mayense]